MVRVSIQVRSGAARMNVRVIAASAERAAIIAGVSESAEVSRPAGSGERDSRTAGAPLTTV